MVFGRKTVFPEGFHECRRMLPALLWHTSLEVNTHAILFPDRCAWLPSAGDRLSQANTPLNGLGWRIVPASDPEDQQNPLPMAFQCAAVQRGDYGHRIPLRHHLEPSVCCMGLPQGAAELQGADMPSLQRNLVFAQQRCAAGVQNHG